MMRHLLAILLLPFTMAVLVPAWLVAAFPAASLSQGASFWHGLTDMAGGVLLISGLGLLAWCIVLFAGEGRGTLAPWDPPSRLVVAGPYRHMRNPMITGVALVLLAECLLAGSWVLGLWLVAFLLINHVYMLAMEEPGLRRRFGDAYRCYEQHVPRWMPRWRPWSPGVSKR